MYADSVHSGNVAGFRLIPRAGVRRPGNADNGKASARRAVYLLDRYPLVENRSVADAVGWGLAALFSG
jgi:hypothetical protein